MPKAKKTETGQAEPFVLKHRVAGAATLLFFGALVLPWVLGPPSDALDSRSMQEQVTPIVEVSSSEIENELLNEIAESEPVEEEVYISKITPFDSELSDQSKLEKTTDESAEPVNTAESKTAVAIDGLESERKAKLKTQQDLIAQREAKAKTAAEQKKRQAELAAQKQSTIEAELAAALSAEAPVKTSDGTPIRSNTSGSNAPSNTNSNSEIERGYVVQVGVYVNKQGADRVVKDLRSKGFSPSTTVVDTNRGEKTATRVWLGPFAQRVDAGKAKSRFAELTGQGSLIREYP